MTVGLITTRDPVTVAFLHNEIERVHDCGQIMTNGETFAFMFIAQTLDREGLDIVIREANARGYKYRYNTYKEQP